MAPLELARFVWDYPIPDVASGDIRASIVVAVVGPCHRARGNNVSSVAAR
jgi:hypothetical protein